MNLASRVVVVGGYPTEGIADIHTYMDQVGKIEQISPHDQFLFVLFESPDSAALAIKDLHGHDFKNVTLSIRSPSETEVLLLDQIFSAVSLDPMVSQMLTIFNKLTPGQKNQFQGCLQPPLPPPSLPMFPVPGTSQIPKLPVFSGEGGKGDVNFERWRYEVRCLLTAGTPHNIITLAIRQSLRKTPADILTWMGENASVNDILEKLEGLYGNVLTGEALLKQFYTASQQPEESVAAWGCRLESILSQALACGQVEKSAMDRMLRKKFWSELHDDRIKMATRHRIDSISSFSQLVTESRVIEQEYKEDKRKTRGPKMGQINQVKGRPEDPSLYILIKELTDKVNSLEAKIAETPKPQPPREPKPDSRPFSQRGNGRHRGCNRGYSNNRQHPGRHISNSKQQDDQEEEVTCHRCGQIGHLSYGCRVNMDGDTRPRNLDRDTRHYAEQPKDY